MAVIYHPQTEVAKQGMLVRNNKPRSHTPILLAHERTTGAGRLSRTIEYAKRKVRQAHETSGLVQKKNGD
jgi:hypothetical protein